MTRKDLIRLIALLEIADDYEEPKHVYDRVIGRLAACNLTVSPEDVRTSLIELIKLGFAKAHWLGPGPQRELEGVPSRDDFEEYFFFITDEGERIVPVWRKQWPFDDVGDLLPECSSLLE